MLPTVEQMHNVLPSISITGTIVLNHGSVFGSVAPSVTALVNPSLGQNSISFGANVSSGLTVGETCSLQIRDSNAQVIFSCEL